MTVATERALGNLPVELTRFVGRRHEVAEAKRLLPQSRLVTLTGIGGVGKTRLALRVAEEVGRAFPDGVWMVDLSGVGEPALVADAAAAAMGLREQLSQTPAALLAEFLASRHLLLLIDNCEHLADAVAALADSLLRAAPHLRILATSREPLDLIGETVVPVPPLSVPDAGLPQTLRGISGSDAVMLFTERARAVVPGFELADDNKTAVAQICQRLEGLPLAIELTAARLRVLSIEQILQRLTDRYRLLTGGPRGEPSRLQTLHQCIDWSYDLLSESERELWARLTVFAGDFDLDAAEEISGAGFDSGEVLELVASLVDKSILMREDAGTRVRYRMLDMLREYGREKLQAADDEAILQLRRRHRDWYERLARSAQAEWIGPKQLDWIDRLNREHLNLCEAMEFSLSASGETRSALRIAAYAYEYWVARASISEARYWIGRALLATDEASTERIVALCQDTVLAAMQTDIASGAARIEQAHHLIAQSGNEALGALAGSADGCLALFSGDLPTAVARLEEVTPVFEATGDLLRQVSALNGLGAAYGLSGDSDRAVTCLERMRALTEARGESVYRSYALAQLGYAAVERGDLERGTTLEEQGLRLARAVDDRPTVAACLGTLAWVAAQRRQAERAAVLAAAAVSVGQSAGSSTTLILEMFGHHKRAQKYAAGVLGQRKNDAAMRTGRGLDIDAALAYALGVEVPPPEQPAAPVVLTPREQQIAALIAEGLTNRAIADKLVISRRTAEGHVENIMTKLHFNTRTQIAAWIAGRGQQPT